MSICKLIAFLQSSNACAPAGEKMAGQLFLALLAGLCAITAGIPALESTCFVGFIPESTRMGDLRGMRQVSSLPRGFVAARIPGNVPLAGVRNSEKGKGSLGLRCSFGSEDKYAAVRKDDPRLKIRIMEEVVRLASDPNLEYNSKQNTVAKLAARLREMKGAQQGREPRSGTADMTRVREALAHLENARVVAVLRGGHPQRLYERGMELSKLGCRAIEVALDTPGSLEVMRALALAVPRSVIIGAATVMSAKQAKAAVSGGARFVTSPTNPRGLITASHSGGGLAIPGGMTPTEILAILSDGALAAKVFPSGAYSPEAMKQLLAVGPFRGARLMVSGGVSPAEAPLWFEAGATFVGMGGGLVGKDVSLLTPPVPGEEWQGKGIAEVFFDTLLSGNS